MINLIKTVLLDSGQFGSEAIGLEIVPQGTLFPYIILNADDVSPSETKNSNSKMDISTLSTTVFSSNEDLFDVNTGAWTIQEKIESVLDNYQGTVDGTEIYVTRIGGITSNTFKLSNKMLAIAESEYQVYVKRI